MDLFFIAEGWLFTIACMLAMGCLIAPAVELPWPVRFSTGAIGYSALIYSLLTAGVGYEWVYLATGGGLLGLAMWRRRRVRFLFLPALHWGFTLLFAVYGVVYFIYALAPEIQPDAMAYHLGLVSEYDRFNAFTDRLGFYELLPQGVEMLFVPAFAIGQHSAAKLVHFSFLLAVLPMVRWVGREAGVEDRAATVAAALVMMAPVMAVSATSAYTDAALVCCSLAVVWLLFRWERERGLALALLAAANAGFCYAIKPTFGWVAVVAFLFLLARRAPLRQLVFTVLVVLAVVSPWLARSAMLTGNPFAPFLNRWFPNEAFTARLEEHLIQSFAAWGPAFHWKTALLDYTVLGGNQGMLGPAFLLLPLALLAMRKRAGRVLMGVSILFALPVLANTGTRFLLPALIPAAMALVSILPAPAALALLALQAAGSTNAAVDVYKDRYNAQRDWRLPELPLRAALRLEPEEEYLSRTVKDYRNNEMIRAVTRPGAKIFALAAVQQCYLPREALVYWQSTAADRMLDFVQMAEDSLAEPAAQLNWKWAAGENRALQITAEADLRILQTRILPDGAPISLWRSRTAGEVLSLDLGTGASGAELLVWPEGSARVNVAVRSDTKEWKFLEPDLRHESIRVDLRKDVMAYLRRAGYRYVLVSLGKNAFGQLAQDMLDHARDWGIEIAGRNGNNLLFYIPD